MTRIVNRVHTLHRPLPEDATFADIIAYWQRRYPLINWADIADKAITQTWQAIGEHLLGLDMQAIDEGLRDINRILHGQEAQQ